MKYIFLVLIGAFCSHGYAQDNSVIRNWGGGVIIPQEKYPAVVQIEMKKKGGVGYCSATIVGPNAILTANHCGFERDEENEDYVPEDKTGTFVFNSKKYTFKFVPHTRIGLEIVQRRKLDVALGITDQMIEGVKPISINFTDDHGSKMIALGYGCTGYKLSETYVKIRDLRNEDRYERFLVSIDDNTPVFACQGDSGGPTLSYNSEMKLQLSSVHMRTDLKSLHLDVRTDSVSFVDFILNSVEQYNLKICGFNLDCE